MDEGRAFFPAKGSQPLTANSRRKAQRVNADAEQIYLKKAMGKFFSTVPTQTAGS